MWKENVYFFFPVTLSSLQITYAEQPLKDLTRALGTYGLKDGDVVVLRQADRRPPPAQSAFPGKVNTVGRDRTGAKSIAALLQGSNYGRSPAALVRVWRPGVVNRPINLCTSALTFFVIYWS